MRTQRANCEICSDTGFEDVGGSGVKDCSCKQRKIRENRLSSIPPRFSTVKLEEIVPRPEIHPRQKEILVHLTANPVGSYILAGGPGCGKTMMMWALYRAAVEQTNRRVVGCSFAELVREMRDFISTSIAGSIPRLPRLRPEDLRQTEVKYAIFLDDLDKEKPSEYTLSQLFELVNGIYEFEHQLVVTTNFSVTRLMDHFDRLDDRFGGPILRRVINNAKLFEMF